MVYLVLCHTDEVELFGGDRHRKVLLGRLCELDPDGAVGQVIVPAGLCGLPAIADDELGKLLPIHADPEGTLFLADQLQGHALHGGSVAALGGKADVGAVTGLDRDSGLGVDAVFVVLGVAVVIVQHKAGVGLGSHQQVDLAHGVLEDVLDILGGHHDSGAAQEHGDACQRDRNLDGLAALVCAQIIVHIVPGAACGQVDGAGSCALFHHVGHQNALAKHKGQVLIGVALGVVRELKEQRTPCRHTVLVGLVHQGVQGGQQAVAQLVGCTDVGQILLVHPRLGDGIIVVGGVQAEAGLEDAVLQPAEQQLGLGSRAGKAADIAAHVGAAG